MDKNTITDEKGRQYEAFVDGEKHIIIGPPEGLVDDAGYVEPFATRLHNILHKRGLYTKNQLKGNAIIGALQEAYLLEAQKLTELYHQYS